MSEQAMCSIACSGGIMFYLVRPVVCPVSAGRNALVVGRQSIPVPTQTSGWVHSRAKMD